MSRNNEYINPMEGKRVIFVFDDKDPQNADGVRGHLEALGDSDYNPSVYEVVIKRIIDILLSGIGIIVLSPVFFVIVVAILVDDPGPVLFTQKRVGRNKTFFKLH